MGLRPGEGSQLLYFCSDASPAVGGCFLIILIPTIVGGIGDQSWRTGMQRFSNIKERNSTGPTTRKIHTERSLGLSWISHRLWHSLARTQGQGRQETQHLILIQSPGPADGVNSFKVLGGTGL